MSENVKGSLLTACRNLLRPLVRILLRHGVGFGEFADAVRASYLDVAKAELVPSGRADTDARLAMLTGMNVRDVHRIRTVKFSGDDDVAMGTIDRDGRVLYSQAGAPGADVILEGLRSQ